MLQARLKERLWRGGVVKADGDVTMRCYTSVKEGATIEVAPFFVFFFAVWPSRKVWSRFLRRDP